MTRTYGLNQRGYFESRPKKVRSFSKVDKTTLSNNSNNPSAYNNIACMEFDCTYDGDEDIWAEDYWGDYF